jgi:hypothetical protein
MLIKNSFKQKKLLEKANNLYGEYYRDNLELLNELLAFIRNEYGQIVVWGAGLKGQAFLSQCDFSSKFIDIVIDMDERKQNKQLITGHMVRGINRLEVVDTVILVINVNYYTSICFDLINSGFDIKNMRIICLDHFIQGRYSLKQIKDNTIWERKRYYD